MHHYMNTSLSKYKREKVREIMKQSKFKHITILSILLLLISTVMPANLFSFQSHADETEARDDGAQRITADALNWTPVSEENPLGGADDFSAILFDEFILVIL